MSSSNANEQTPEAATGSRDPQQGTADWQPDTKDWTWVMTRPCAECGEDATDLTPQDIAARIRQTLPLWQRLLVGEGFGSGRAGVESSGGDHESALRRRPAANTWSPLEYAAHVRDVFRVMHYRLDLMLREDAPTFPDWDQDQSAIEDRYNEDDPRVVSVQLASAGRGFADALDSVLQRDIGRRGIRGNGSEFTVESFARYAWHDVAHHLHDVGLR
ncbi:maleylpyruvate isomerase N-terminal domain-containing protein [Zhihengliuella alba]|uniref:Maleylpyruvate isomerase N-terminal domain-containing protein n=1 Tax=Zhihengliuella alba TaxID=547018 RepID=A0ABP7DBJ3_9MICC